MRKPPLRPFIQIEGNESRIPISVGEAPSSLGKRMVFVVLLIVLAIILADPELMPEREILAARASLNAAKDIQADLYAPEAWDRAEKVFDLAELEIEAQSEKGILVRRYDRARRLFSGAQHAAERAIHVAEVGREESRRRAITTIQTITETLSQADAIASELEKCARNPAFLKDEIEILRGALDTQMEKAATIQEVIASDDYTAALRLAEPVVEESSRLLDELQRAKARSRC